MRKVLLITPYNLTRNEVGGAFTYQFVDKLADKCVIDVVLYQYDGDVLDKPRKNNINIIYSSKIKIFDRYLSWFQCPF